MTNRRELQGCMWTVRVQTVIVVSTRQGRLPVLEANAGEDTSVIYGNLVLSDARHTLVYKRRC